MILAVLLSVKGKGLDQMTRTLCAIAQDIARDWKNVNYGARPYLDAMYTLSAISDRYYMDSAESIVRYFLSNASAWRGDKAREIKAELKAMLQGKGR